MQALLVGSLARSLYLLADSHNSLDNYPRSLVVLKNEITHRRVRKPLRNPRPGRQTPGHGNTLLIWSGFI